MQDYPSNNRSRRAPAQPPHVLSRSHFNPPNATWSTNQGNSCGSSDFRSTGFSILPPRQALAGCAEGEFRARRERHLIAQRLSGLCWSVWFQSGPHRFSVNPVSVPLFLWVSLWREIEFVSGRLILVLLGLVLYGCTSWFGVLFYLLKA